MTSHRPAICILGLGGPHGDDQLGWIAVDRLKPLVPEGVCVRRLRSAADLTDGCGDCERIVVIDACLDQGPSGARRQWHWPDKQLEPLTFSGTHDLGLAAALALAEQLGRLPADTSVWSISARRPAPDGGDFGVPLSPEVQASLDALVSDLVGSLGHA